MKRSLILAIDQGTTNTKVLLLAADGSVVARASRPLDISFPQPGWVEQEAGALWLSVVESISECLDQVPDADIVAVGVSNQRETVVVWDRQTGLPAAAAAIWQCRRSAAFCDDMRRRGYEQALRERTGLGIDPLFSASKARWLLDHIPDGQARAKAGALCVGTVDSWVLWNLTGGAVHACDATNASRTQLMILETLDWDPDLLRLFGIPRAALPEIRRSSGDFGRTVACGRLPAGAPVYSLIGDSHAALFGHAAFQPGAVKATYGTGSSLMTLIDKPKPSSAGLSTTVAWWLGESAYYAFEGNITVTGGAVQWLGQFLGLPDGSRAVADLAQGVTDTGGVYLVPAFAGLGAPHWDADARGLICGLTRGSTAAHVARATIESIAYQVRDVFEAMRAQTLGDLPALLADGGASQNNELMQFQADILGRPVIRNLSTDLSAIGAAWLAGLRAGFWHSVEELAGLARATDCFEPRMGEPERERRCQGWASAVERARLRQAAG